MAESPTPLRESEPASKRGRSEIRFPVYGLADCVIVAKAIYEKGGGIATSDHLAAYLGYKSAVNGSYISRIAAAKMFGLIVGPPNRMELTPLAQKILMPIQDTDPRQALIEAFLSIPLYKAVYDEYHGKELPQAFGLKNALRTRFGVTPQRIDRAYRALMDSAETAGFFEVKSSRTQLIIPNIQSSSRVAPQPSDESEHAERDAGGGGDGGDDGRPPVVKTQQDLRNEYVSALIGVFRDKGAKGEIDDALMTRIEKLLDLTQ